MCLQRTRFETLTFCFQSTSTSMRICHFMIITMSPHTTVIWNIFHYWLHLKRTRHVLTLLSKSLNGQRLICSFFKNPASACKAIPNLGLCYLCIAYIKCKHADIHQAFKHMPRCKHTGGLPGKSLSETWGTTADVLCTYNLCSVNTPCEWNLLAVLAYYCIFTATF